MAADNSSAVKSIPLSPLLRYDQPMSVPFLLAPMASLSHRALRELIGRYGGCDEYFTEMISAAALLNGGPLESYYIDALPDPSRVVYQLMGGDAAQIERAAAMLNQLDCAGIDLNMGCSAPEIVRSGAGVRWMAQAEEAAAMADRVRRVVSRRLSVKLRIGWEEDFDFLVRFCRLLEAAGVQLITLHPRTAKEKFKRSARWNYVGRLRDELGIPVAGNGDILGAEDLGRRAAGPCDAVMVGRAAVRTPWIFAEARALEGVPPPRYPDSIDLLAVAEDFLDLLELRQPPEFFESRAKRFFLYFCDNVVWAHHLKTLLGREKQRRGMSLTLKNYFAEHPAERYCRMPKAALKPSTT